jgi:predicted O-methyltransferase YrrM
MYRTKIAQVDGEIDAFIGLLKSENVRSYLEIGSEWGGSLWKVATTLPAGSRVMSIDYPQPKRGTDESLRACIKELRGLGYEAKFCLDRSDAQTVIDTARAAAPFDAIFIDGNHTLPVVTKDWENYGPMARIVAFHDIAWDRPVRPGRLPIEVSHLWRSIKGQYRHVEFVEPGSEKGIGVLWR